MPSLSYKLARNNLDIKLVFWFYLEKARQDAGYVEDFGQSLSGSEKEWSNGRERGVKVVRRNVKVVRRICEKARVRELYWAAEQRCIVKLLLCLNKRYTVFYVNPGVEFVHTW